MKVLFVVEDFKIEPLGIMYLSAALKKAGHETDIVKTNEDVFEKVVYFKPDFVAYSIVTGSQKVFLDINRELKRRFPKIKTIAGGPHVTFFRGYEFHYTIKGEGEEAIVDIVNGNYDGKLKTLPNLDDIPFPDRELIYKYPEHKDNPIKHFIAGRGCPYDCSYCFNRKYAELYKGQKRVRLRSPLNLIKEIQEVKKKYPMKMVYFQDDTFILNKKWLKEFSKLYQKNIKLPYHCHVRANLIDRDVCYALKESGCYSVHIGIETADDELRNRVLNRNMTKEQIRKACMLLKLYGIKYMTQNIIGLPGGRLDKDIETLKFNIELKPTYAWVSIYQPYPGTELGEECVEKGLCSRKDVNSIRGNFFDGSILDIPNKEMIRTLQKIFAVIVEHPELMERLPQLLQWNDTYIELYRSFRKDKDKELYGVEL